MVDYQRRSHFNPDEEYASQLGAIAMAAQSSPMPTMITDSLAPGAPIMSANDAFLAMTGFNRHGLVASPIATLFGAPASAETLVLLQSALANGEPGIWQMTVERANGSTFFAVVYLSPIHSDGGTVLNHVVNVFDIASMLCLSREKSEIYPAIYDKAPGFIAISTGKDHKYTYANAAYEAFVKRGSLVGRTVVEAFPELAEQGVIAILDEVYQTGRPFRATDMPFVVHDPENQRTETRWFDAVYQPVRNDGGAIIGLFCEGYDVTELHETNEALAALRLKMAHVSRVNAMGTMAATLVHELNQPLTAISNYIAGVRPLGGTEPDVGRLIMALKGIKEASERAAGITDHVRQLTKHRKPTIEPFNLKHAADECIKLVRLACQCKVRFDNQIASNVIMMADRIKIQQVLINLLQNACDAIADSAPGLVSLQAVQSDQQLIVSVTDTGTGVPPEAEATLFAWTESSKGDGMGIGLSICRTIVEIHSGNIWLERTGSEGSEFRFSVPLSQSEATAGQD